MKRKKGIIDTGILIGLSLAAVVGLMVYLFPTVTWPSPGGRYDVGLKIIELEDKSRQDPFADVTMSRRLVVDVWYPAADTAGNRRSPWFRNAPLFINSLASNYELPAIIFQHLRTVKSNSYLEAEPLMIEGGAPVVIFSPGTPAIVPLYFSFAEYLASRGYVVIGIEHPYGAAVVEFSDGTQAHFSRERAEQFPGADSFEEGVRLGMELMAGDFSFVIDELENMADGDRLPVDFFDTDRIAVFGHSGGGGVIQFLSQREKRIDALISFDPALFVMTDDELKAGMDIPALVMETGKWLEREEAGNLYLLTNSGEVKPYHLKLPNANHPDFAMLDHLSPLAHYLGFTGTFMTGGGEEYLYNSISSFLEFAFDERSEEEFLETLLSRKDVQLFIGDREINR